ncbi:MAG: bifunctional UDP-N-acetylglucosamine diphosphorylase/glucosamine-1-phosphate N-acetyltransferase GlmU, partial [Halofilum sp. (in: g-proteobacteria)]
LAALADTAAHADCALLTVALDDPRGYGRIVRGEMGGIERIVEDHDASAEERAIREINTGLLAMRAGPLAQHVAALDRDNAQGEYYLTDVIGRVRASGGRVDGVQPDFAWEVQGVNSRAQLAALERAWQRHLAERLLGDGATLRDPERIDVRGNLTADPDAMIDVGCVFEGVVHLGEGVEIGPHCVIRDSVIAAGTRVHAHSVIESGDIGRDCEIGPFARMRPGVRLAEGAKLGNFVETKNADIGPGSKVNHLAYVGDSDVGRGVNIGAGSITCNYDGRNKNRTIIEDGAFIGSDCQLVAPVRVGAGAWIGAGSTITQDAPAGQLTVSRTRQKSIPGWKHPADREGE